MTQARNIGAMRHRVSIRMPVRAEDGGGGFEVTYPELCKAMASIDLSTSKEVFAAQRLNLEITHTLVIRYNKNVKQGGHVMFGDRLFYIQSAVDKDERKRFTTLYTREGGAP